MLTPIVWWVVAPELPPGVLSGTPLYSPLKPTPIQQMLCHQQCQICPVGWTVPIVSSLLHCWLTSLSLQQTFMVILIVINIYISSFNDVDPSHIMLVDCCMLYCREWGPRLTVWWCRPPWSISLAFFPFLLAFLFRHTQHNSTKPKSDHKPTTYPTKCLHQYSADEGISSYHPVCMHGGQTLMLYGCTYLLSGVGGSWWSSKTQKNKKFR
jgi:hypothetical protein